MNNSIRTDSDAAALRRIFCKSNNDLSKSLARMSSGLKVLSAKDDASGAVISAKTEVKLHGLNIANNNIQSGIAMFNVAKSALKEAENILLKLRDLSLQAANSTLDDDARNAIQNEANILTEELERIQHGTVYNNINLFDNKQDKKVSKNNENNQPAQSQPDNNNNIDNITNPLSANTLNLSTNTNMLSGKQNGKLLSVPNGNKDSENTTEATIESSSNTSQTIASLAPKKLLSAGNNLLGSANEGIVADNEVNDGVYITGAFDFAAGEEYKINIDGVAYTVKNRNTTDATISYSKEIETGIITFTCNTFTITGQNGAQHNIKINGKSNYIYGGNLNDTFDTYDNWSRTNYFYGQGGDDTFNVNSVQNYYYGGADNDTFNVIKNASNCSFNGDAGDDTFNINAGGGTSYGGAGNDTFNINVATTAYGQDGEDEFYITKGNGCFIDGGTGTNYIENNGTNTTMANVPGANSYSIDFDRLEEKNITISTSLGDRHYTVKNRTNAQSLVVKVEDSGQIVFKNNNFTITSQDEEAQNVSLTGSSTWYSGSNLNDTVYSTGWGNRIYTKDGDDSININASATNLYAGSGNDTVYLTGGSYNAIQTEDGNDEAIYINTASYHYINLGEGDDIIKGQNSNGVANNNKTSNGIFIYGGNGTNTFNLTGNYNGGLKDINAAEFTSYKVEASKTQNLTISTNQGNYAYSIQNRVDHDTEIQYKYDEIENKIIFAGNKQ